MSRIPTHRGFSLVEVVIAVGIFAVAIAAILALLPSLTRQTTDSADLLSAQRLPEALHVELERVATETGFDSFAGAIPVMNAPLANGFALVGSRDGLRIASEASTASIAVDEQYFLIEVWRFAQAPLAFTSSSAMLGAYVRVSWPYRVRGAANPTALNDRSQFTFAVSVNR